MSYIESMPDEIIVTIYNFKEVAECFETMSFAQANYAKSVSDDEQADAEYFEEGAKLEEWTAATYPDLVGPGFNSGDVRYTELEARITAYDIKYLGNVSIARKNRSKSKSALELATSLWTNAVAKM